MNPPTRKFAVITGLLLLFGSACLNGQILRDSSTLVLIRQDIDLIYNFKFNDARKLSDEIIKRYPDHPIVFLIKGMITYWENYPLLPINYTHESFEADMQKCVKISESEISPDSEAEYLLANKGRGNYLNAQLYIFKGILQEKKYHDLRLAREYYYNGISDLSVFGEYGNEYSAYGYFGLSRIYTAKEEKHTGKIYRNQAEKLVEFKKINFDR